MDLMNRYRLRVETCIGTIIDVHKRCGSPYESKEFLGRFEKLKRAMDNMDMSKVSEGDILMVEKATNALLAEFRPVFETEDHGPVYEDVTH